MSGLDDAATDGAGAGKILEQMVAIAGADGALQRKQLLGKAAQNLQRCVLVGQEHIAPHGRITGGNPGEIAKPGGRELDHLIVGQTADIIGHANHRIGDEMRRVAGHGADQIVMIRLHQLDIRAHPPPQQPQPLHRRRFGSLDRHQQAPTIVEQFGKAGPRPAVFGSGQGVAGHEMHALGNMRRDRLDHRPLDRPHIGNGCPRFQRRGNVARHLPHGPDRHAKHHQIGPRDRLGRRIANPVTQADLARDVAGFGRTGKPRHLARQPGAFHRMKHRPGNQPQPDQRHPVIDHLAHAAPTPLKRAMAEATRRQAISSPTVIRSAFGSL